MDEKHPDIRMAEALETIADCLLKLAKPPMLMSSTVVKSEVTPEGITFVKN